MKKLYGIPLVLCLFLFLLSCTIGPAEPEDTDSTEEISGEQPADHIDGEMPAEEMEGDHPADERDVDEPDKQEKAILQLAEISDDVVAVNLINTLPVRGVQFTIAGVEIVDVLTTSRSEDFFVSFNGENGKVMMVSLARDVISPGEGSIAEIVFDGSSSARLSEIIIAE